MPNEQEKFLNEIEVPLDVFNQPIEPEKVEVVEQEENVEELRNRRERRLNAKLQAERESSIQLAARLDALTEVKKSQEASDPDYLKTIERIYGTDSPENSMATDLLKQAFKGVEDSATEKAYVRMKAEQEQAQQAVQQEEKVLDSMVDEIEDTYQVDLQSDATRKGFFTLLEKMSPKDLQGNIIQYADHHSVWELYQSQNTKKPDTQAKDFSSRSMVQSGASAQSQLTADVNTRWLQENGLI